MAAGADQNLNIVVKLKDEASKSFDTLTKKMEGVQKSIKPAADLSKKFALALTGAGVAAAGFAALAVKSAMEAQVETARTQQTLNNAFESMSVKSLNAIQKLADKAKGPGADAFDFISDSIGKASQAAVKLGFDDEEAAGSMANLFQRTGDLNKTMELNALAMDLARAKGIGLADAGNMIGMVMSGNGRALKQYGIEISDTLTPMEALKVLQEKVGGQAEAFNGTLAGQSEVLKAQWGNLLETIGEKLIPVLSVLMEKYLIPFVSETLPKWIENMSNLNQWLSEHQELLIVVAGVIVGALTPAIISFGIAAVSAFAAATIAAAPWLLAGAVIGGLVAAILWVVKNWAYVKEQIRLTWEGIKLYFKEGVNVLIGAAEAYANAWIKAINFVINGLNKLKVSIPDWVPEIGGKSWGVNIKTVGGVSLPRFEHGGIIPGARGTAVPIIAHGQEQIIPAGGGANGGGGMYIVNINNPQVRNNDDITRMRDEINKAMRDVVRIHKLQSI